METIIKKAIEGGYEKERYYFDENGNFGDEPYEVVVMKSSFWQALSKACEWQETGYGAIPYWKQIALDFHRINLSKGWSYAIAYLQQITNIK